MNPIRDIQITTGLLVFLVLVLIHLTVAAARAETAMIANGPAHKTNEPPLVTSSL